MAFKLHSLTLYISCIIWFSGLACGFNWQKPYNKLFGTDESVSLSDRQILSILSRLDSSIDNTDASEAEKTTVHFWAEVTAVPRACTFEYIRSLAQQFEDISEKNKNSNFEQLEKLAVEQTLRVCGKRLKSFEQMLMPIVGGEFNPIFHALDRASEYYRDFHEESRENTYEDEQTITYLSEYMLAVVGFEHRKNFVAAWKQGPCSDLTQKLNAPEMHLHSDYLKIVRALDLDPREYCSGKTLDWVMIMQMCLHFDENKRDLDMVAQALQKKDKRVEEHVKEDMLDFIDE